MKLFLIIIMVGITAVAGAEPIRLPANTVVAVRATETLSARQYKAGQEVILVVASTIKINGQKLLQAGAPVIAFVNESKGAQMAGISGSMTVTLRSTTAVDGTTVPLSGSMVNQADSEVGSTVAIGVVLCPLALLNKGKQGEIIAGTEIRAMTVGEVEIDPDNMIEIEYLSTDYEKQDSSKEEDDSDDSHEF